MTVIVFNGPKHLTRWNDCGTGLQSDFLNLSENCLLIYSSIYWQSWKNVSNNVASKTKCSSEIDVIHA